MKIKAGYRTSEFWFTLVSFIFSGLYLTGLIKENDQKEELISVVTHAVESCILIGGQLFVLYRYVKGREEVKKLAEQENLAKIKSEEKISDEPERASTKRSRKTAPRTKNKNTRSKKNSAK